MRSVHQCRGSRGATAACGLSPVHQGHGKGAAKRAFELEEHVAELLVVVPAGGATRQGDGAEAARQTVGIAASLLRHCCWGYMHATAQLTQQWSSSFSRAINRLDL